MIQVRSHVVSYKGRRVNRHADVEVYRNLNRKGAWYSVRQGGRVVGHTQFILLHGVRCVVQEAGRKRALATRVRNVHAYLVGRVGYDLGFWDEGKPLQLTHRAGYLPDLGFWYDYKCGLKDIWGDLSVTRQWGMKRAECALLSKHGLSVNEPSTEDD